MGKKEIVLGAAFLAVGVYLGMLATRVPYIELNPQVDIISVGNLLLVLLLAIVIPTHLTSYLDNKRAEKNLLLGEVDILCSTLDEIDILVKSEFGTTLTSSDFSRATFLFKRARSQLRVISDEVSKTSDGTTIKCKDSLNRQLTDYWEFVTGDQGIAPNGFEVTASFILKQSGHHDKATRTSRRLKFAINRI